MTVIPKGRDFMQQEWPYDKKTTVCFSGHRPEKLPDKGDLTSLKMKGVLSMLYYEIQQSIEQGFKTFIIGGAKGIDLWAAEFIMQFKYRGSDIDLVIALPYKDFGVNYTGMELFLRGNAVKTSSLIVNVSEEPSKSCYRKRNQFMIDHSSRLIAVISNLKSGTGQTVNYAEKNGIETKIINARKFSAYVDASVDSGVKIVHEETDIKNLIKVYYST